MKDDPGITRVREARRRISEECGNDAKKLVAHYIERQRRREALQAQKHKEEKAQPEA